MFTESRGGECFDTMGDTGAKEQFNAHLEELEPLHARLDHHQLEMTFIVEVITNIDRHYEEIKDVSSEAIVYASFVKHYFGGDFLKHIVSEEVIIAEIAEELQVPTYRMRYLIQSFQLKHKEFNVYSWRNYELASEFRDFVLNELVYNTSDKC